MGEGEGVRSGTEAVRWAPLLDHAVKAMSLMREGGAPGGKHDRRGRAIAQLLPPLTGI